MVHWTLIVNPSMLLVGEVIRVLGSGPVWQIFSGVTHMNTHAHTNTHNVLNDVGNSWQIEVQIPQSLTWWAKDFYSGYLQDMAEGLLTGTKRTLRQMPHHSLLQNAHKDWEPGVHCSLQVIQQVVECAWQHMRACWYLLIPHNAGRVISVHCTRNFLETVKIWRAATF